MNRKQALANMVRGYGLTIHQYHDKKRKKRRYFAEIEGETISPILNYEALKFFLLGWIGSKLDTAKMV